MEIKLSTVLALLFAALCAVASSMSLPGDNLKDNSVQLDDKAGLDEGRRATWLETRDVEADFKELVLLTLHELASEGRIDPRVLTETEAVNEENEVMEKRGRWQGFCFRRTKSGRIFPYICWKGDRN